MNRVGGARINLAMGAALAQQVGAPVVWDFRTNDVQIGRRRRAACTVLSLRLRQMDQSG